MECLPRSRQNLMFSATIPPKIEKLASEMLRDPLFISFGEVADFTGIIVHLSLHLLLPPGPAPLPSPVPPPVASDILWCG